MTQEEKDLLLKDLCGRLPYGVMYETKYGPRIINDLFIYSNGPVYTDHNVGDYNEVYGIELGHIKPYLRPMSSMTEEEEKELSIILNYEFYVDDDFALVAEDDRHRIRLELCDGYIDWLNAHHFDFRNLIEKGLALEAPEDMYKED